MARDWLAMRPEDFDTDLADTELTLFDVSPSEVAVDDGHGTGDLLAEIPEN